MSRYNNRALLWEDENVQNLFLSMKEMAHFYLAEPKKRFFDEVHEHYYRNYHNGKDLSMSQVRSKIYNLETLFVSAAQKAKYKSGGEDNKELGRSLFKFYDEFSEFKSLTENCCDSPMRKRSRLDDALSPAPSKRHRHSTSTASFKNRENDDSVVACIIALEEERKKIMVEWEELQKDEKEILRLEKENEKEMIRLKDLRDKAEEMRQREEQRRLEFHQLQQQQQQQQQQQYEQVLQPSLDKQDQLKENNVDLHQNQEAGVPQKQDPEKPPAVDAEERNLRATIEKLKMKREILLLSQEISKLENKDA